MKKICFLLLVVISFSFSKESNLKKFTHFSKSLNKDQSLIIYFPEKNTGSKILFLLHGAYGNYKNWTDLTDIEFIADQFNLTIVMPDGGEFSWYNNSPVKKDWQYESYFINELIPFVDSLFNNKNKKAICGLSMGGYGALKFASKYPEKFISVSSLSGVLDILNHKTNNWWMDSAFGPIKFYKKKWEENDLLLLAPNLKNKMKIKFDIGTEDRLLEENRVYQKKLNELKIAHEYIEFEGNHNWKYWGMHIEDHLKFHSKNLE
ncbi:MAG: alpha/beta hydrolase family protein [Bacteroidetes bacterium]|nr:alpha/beta hydrolase family protein [Bacteroidota bacterium]